jgi:hypothetical protein
MFGRRYFGGAYYGARYWGDGGSTAPPGASAAQVWNYVLSNGLTAGATLVAVHTWLNELHLIHGLRSGSPLTVTPTNRNAGIVDQTIAEAGNDVTVTRT